MPAIAPVVVQLYLKDNCGLCEEMLSEVEAFLSGYQPPGSARGNRIHLELRDIEDNAEWTVRYREYVPTLVVNDQEVCHYFFDAEELTEALECPSHT